MGSWTIVFDHGIIDSMEKIAISKFKAQCLAILAKVRKTGRSVQITRFGEPVAEIVPPSPAPRAEDWVGSMRETGRVVGDIVSPVVDDNDWEVLRK